MSVAWRAFTPAYKTARRAQSKPLGAHAFDPVSDRSVCGYAPIAKTKCEVPESIWRSAAMGGLRK